VFAKLNQEIQGDSIADCSKPDLFSQKGNPREGARRSYLPSFVTVGFPS
jgi:hypothetical protein